MRRKMKKSNANNTSHSISTPKKKTTRNIFDKNNRHIKNRQLAPLSKTLDFHLTVIEF